MSEIAQWLKDWHAAHEHELRSRGISSAVKRPVPGTPSRGRPKATALSLTLESDERAGTANCLPISAGSNAAPSCPPALAGNQKLPLPIRYACPSSALTGPRPVGKDRRG